MPSARPVGALLLLLASAPLALAYHIDGAATAPSGPPGGLSTADWYAGHHTLVLCESEGPHDDLNAGSPSRPGLSALCSTGRNDATGVHAPLATTSLAAGCEPVLPPGTPAPPTTPCTPGSGDYTRLDACAFTTYERNAAYGPFLPAAGCTWGLAPLPPTTATPESDHAWVAQLGPYECAIAPQEAFYYAELFAWWTWTPHPSSSGDPAGAPHAGTGAGPNDPGRRDAYHGHVFMFVDLPASGKSATGSAVTTTAAAPFLPASAYDDCGWSPGPDGAGTPVGPVFRGP